MNVKMYIAVVAFAIGVSVTNAIICHSCNSEYDPRCGDPFDAYSIGQINCSYMNRLEHMPELEPTICRKTTQKVYGKVRVVRGCGYITDSRDDKDCVKRSGTHDVFAVYCSCTKDLCNDAPVPVPPQFHKLFSIILALALIIYPQLL